MDTVWISGNSLESFLTLQDRKKREKKKKKVEAAVGQQ